jgi:hypothetical protein
MPDPIFTFAFVVATLMGALFHLVVVEKLAVWRCFCWLVGWGLLWGKSWAIRWIFNYS